MHPLTISEARASFSRVTRRVIKTLKPVVVRTPKGLVQIAPYDLPETVPPAPPGVAWNPMRCVVLAIH